LKKIDLGQTLQLLGNVGVIVGILLLVYELNQNRDLMEAQTRNAIAETIVQILIDEANNLELGEIGLKIQSGEDLSALEDRQYGLHQAARFRYWENVYYQYNQGLFDDNEYLGQRESWRERLSRTPIRDRWCRRIVGDVHSQEFVAEINSLLSDGGCGE